MSLTFEELLARSAAKEDVLEEDVREFLDSSDVHESRVAWKAVAKTSIRRALTDAVDLAREQGFTNANTLDAIEQLAPLSDVEEPFIEVLKQRGLSAARRGDFETSMKVLQDAVWRALRSSHGHDARSRRAMRYVHDDEIEKVLETFAGRFVAPPGRATVDTPLRLVMLCSTLSDEDAPSVMTYKRAVHLRDAGFDVEIASTELVPTGDSRIGKRVRDLGFRVFTAAGETFEKRTQSLLQYFSDRPANAITSTVVFIDLVGKLIGCIGVAPVQAYDCSAIEPSVGNYDLLFHGVSPKQEINTKWPGRSRYFGSTVAMAEEIDAAEALARTALGVPEDAVLLATFGRLEKCDKPEYLQALGRILVDEPSAWLVLAGRDGMGAVPTMMEHFRRCGVAGRIRYLGPSQEAGPSLVKTVDIYCDTYPWPGGQSLLDAMQAGLPIVAMRTAHDPDLDPSGCGPTTAMAEANLDGVVELAGAGDVDDYVRIARAYVGDAKLRARDGAKLREKAVRDCSMKRATYAYGEAIREIILRKANA